MSFTTIEVYERDTSLVEDEDGIRALFVRDEWVPYHIWIKAYTEGIGYIVWRRSSDMSFMHITAEDFIEFEQMLGERFLIPECQSYGSLSALSYREFLLGRKSQVLTQLNQPTLVNVHTHSEFSPLDGLSKIEELVDLAVKYNQPALAITDHGVCAGHPYLNKYAKAAGIKPLFGIEAYFVNDRLVRNPGKQDYFHLVLWAQNHNGLNNLWAASTEANKTGFYYKPRMDWDILTKFNEGLIASTACLRGPLSALILAEKYEEALLLLSRFQQLFPDRLYAELHANQLPDQIKVNEALVSMAGQLSLPLIAAVDSHYPCKDDYEIHQTWLRAQIHKDKGADQEDKGLFTGHQDYHLMTRSEVVDCLSYLPQKIVEEACNNTVAMADSCNADMNTKSDPPIFSKPTSPDESVESLLKRDVDRLVEVCLGNWNRKVVGKSHPESEYEERFAFEMKMLVDKKFTGYFDIVADYVRAAKQKPMLVGPSRGSGGGSLVAYLSDITEIDPIEHDLLFARFMTKGRTEAPDFDIDFPTSQRPWLHHYVAERWGHDHVVRVGTQGRLKNKGVVRELARIYKEDHDIDYKDINAICDIIDAEESSSAGLGYSWDVIYAAIEDDDRYRQSQSPGSVQYTIKYHWLFEMAAKLVGRIKSYGKHAAGIVISTGEPLSDRLPMRQGDEDQMVAEFDMEALADLGLLKFDFLTLRTLDTLDVCRSMIADEINVYDWKDEYNDPAVWQMICDGTTKGIFQIETRDVTRLAKQLQPRNLADLSDVTTLVRPGPRKSGLTDQYFRRRAGLEEVKAPDPRLEAVLGKTFGCIVYQEDIMSTCMILAGYDEEHADKVRKILGKKKVELVEDEGRKFKPACVQGGMQPEAVDFLWEQMAEFAKYSFNRAHALGYAVLSYWTAWFKYHYPAEFLTAVLSTVEQERIPEFINEARRLGLAVLPPDINCSGKSFKAEGNAIRYGLLGILGVGEKAVETIVEHQPYASFDDFRAIMKDHSQAVNSGTIKLLAKVGAFDSLHPNRRQLVVQLERETSGEDVRCIHKDDSAHGPNNLPCVFDWASEPVELTAKGRAKKRKPIPARCTKACRNYTPPKPLTVEVDPYTEFDIQDIEKELLGIWLSSTPFERFAKEDLEQCSTAEEVEKGPEGTYLVAILLKTVRRVVDRNNKPMAFMTVQTQMGDLDITVFHSGWSVYGSILKSGNLGVAYIKKTDRGINLLNYMPI